MPTTEQLALLALCKTPGLNWHLIAREAQRPGGPERLLLGGVTETTPEARQAKALLGEWAHRGDELLEKVEAGIAPALGDPGIRLTIRRQGRRCELMGVHR
jgi:DNA processing protein